jgi:hypothetical protein
MVWRPAITEKGVASGKLLRAVRALDRNNKFLFRKHPGGHRTNGYLQRKNPYIKGSVPRIAVEKLQKITITEEPEAPSVGKSTEIKLSRLRR